MKTLNALFLLIILLTSVFASHGQSNEIKSLLAKIEGQWKVDENKNLSYQKVVDMPGIGKDILFQRADNYFIYNYNSGKDVIQTKDKDQGLIIGKGLWSKFFSWDRFFGTYDLSADHILRIDVKDEKVRVTLTVQKFILTTTPPSVESSYPLGNTYPINSKSESKTKEGKAFYALHIKCLKTIEGIISNLKNDAIAPTKNSNW